ncbi:ornithine cyclodeaminase [Pararhizobium mangrovi]|uniref:Ornithine cyclodeaminase n=1 Tax=Pararhizobium mangrovi TaxID=2590452 RepID=A0A506U6G5_9HYPH|nr:ornithine cyclodeaminase [Pararhizobium mangrovi]TPW28946.1 ornithine cyclodeaminase [Pararhizobium mangrovi]
MTRIFTADAVHRALAFPFLIDHLAQAHLGAMPQVHVAVHADPGATGNQFVVLTAWLSAEMIAVKTVGVFPENRDLSPPQASVQGLVTAFDGKTGAPLMAADGEAMTFRKTAADSGLGSRLLAREDAETLLVVGAGGLAPYVAEAHMAARPGIANLLVWNRTPARAEALAARLARPGLSATPVSDLAQAVRRADIVSCVTMSDTPLVKGEWLKPGAHLDLVGAYRPDLREADDAAMARGTVFVDTRSGMENAGDLTQPVDNGTIGWNAVRADLFDLVRGRIAGRSGDEEITIFKNVGGGHLDLFTAQALIAAS